MTLYAVPRAEFARALQFYLPDILHAPDVGAMLGDRLAQNALMQRFCAERGIPFLDTTDALEARFRSGENCSASSARVAL